MTTSINIDINATDPLLELRRLATQYFESFTSDIDFYVTLRFWGVKDPSEELSNAIRHGYAANKKGWTEFYAIGLGWAGLQIRGDLELDDFVVAITAITEGLALRHRFEPESLIGASGQDLYSEMLIAIVQHFTEPASASSHHSN